MDQMDRLALQRAASALNLAAGTQAKGRTVARALLALALAKGRREDAREIIAGSGWHNADQIKAAVSAMTSAGGLTGPAGLDFIGRVWPRTILGRMLGIRQTDFMTRTVAQTSGPAAEWISETNPKPIQAGTFSEDLGLERRKVTAMSVISHELARDANGENLILADLERAVIMAVDQAFIDPDNGGVAGERPASVTNAGTTTASSGSTAANIRTDLGALIDSYAGHWDSAVLVTHPRLALRIGLMQHPLASSNLRLAGDSDLAGIPLLLSEAVPQTSDGYPISLIDASEVWLAGGRDAVLNVAHQASIEMETEPTNDTGTPTATQLVSLWQTNAVGLRAELWANWRLARSTSAATITGCSYSLDGGSE